MKFHKHETVFESTRREFKRIGNQFSFAGWDEFYYKLISRYTQKQPPTVKTELSLDWNEQALMCLAREHHWYKECRPYYKAWPAICNEFSRFKLDVRQDHLVFSRRVFAVRFAEGWELRDEKCFCTSFLTSAIVIPTITGQFCDMLAVFPIVYCQGERIWDGTHMWAVAVNSPGRDETLEEELNQVNELIGSGDMYPGEPGLRVAIMKAAVMTHLMADDPSIIQPDVLAKDRYRFDNTTDPELRQRLINKAKRCGVVGWRIGEQYETIPHYRRPHPALYHVGKGKKEKRIVFRSGSVVHRKKLTEVPTGWIDDDGTEIEK